MAQWLVGPWVQIVYMLSLGSFGHMGQLLIIVALGFVIPQGFTDAGVVVDTVEGPTLLFAENGKLIADGKAAAMTLSVKGNSGFLPCHLCANVLMKGALSNPDFPLDNPDNKLVELTQPTLTGCIANTDDSIFKNADELHRLHTLWQQKKLTKGKYELAEKATGLKYNPQGLLWDLQLRNICRPIDFALDDWSHVYLCKGIGGDAIWCLLAQIKTRVGNQLYARLREEVCAWSWPRHRSSQCKNTWQIFSEKRAKSNSDANGWKSSSSELLSVAPILLNWASTHFGTSLPGEVESFRRLCAIIDYFLALKYGKAADANNLQNLIEAHFRQHVLVHGDDLIGPKWHRALHLPRQIAKMKGLVLDTFCNERDHQIPKGFADCYRGHLHKMEEYVFCRTLAYQKEALLKFNERPGLVGECHWQEELGAHLANSLHCKGLRVSARDFVVTKTKEVVEVRVCGLSGSNLFLLGDACEVTHNRETSMEVARTESLRLIWITDNTDVEVATCWQTCSGSDRLRIIT